MGSWILCVCERERGGESAFECVLVYVGAERLKVIQNLLNFF